MRYFELTTESKVISVLRFNHKSKSVERREIMESFRIREKSEIVSTTNVTIGTHDHATGY